MAERGIVRPLDPEQETWEISHDFLVPLLDAILVRWSISLWRRMRPAVPWIAASMMIVPLGVLSRTQDPVNRLTELGWTIQRPDNNTLSLLYFGPKPPIKESLETLLKIKH